MISVLCTHCILEHRTMILKFITLILIIIKSTRCSIVHDESNQETTYVSKYCPKQKYCREGSHVVCMYYDHNHVFGPRCGNPVSVQLTPTMVQTILANVNDIRGKVATGTEKGKNDELLPRAYGLMKLEWDKELAFLAQVLANQCLGGREDVCRATEKFPNPSQTIAIVRYKYPNWEYLKPNNTDEGLNEEKLIFSIDRFLKSTHALKKSVTKSIITSCPRLHELPDVNLKYYLNLIRGGATHIGCGVSAYSKYRMSGDNDSMQNCVQIVCNISDAPKARQPVYKIIPPIPGHGYSKRCGCPKGYRESRSCLCEKDTKFTWKARDDAPTKPTHNSIQATKNIKQKKGPQLKNQLKTGLKRDSNKGINNRPHNDAKNDEVRLASHNKPKPSIIRGIPEKRDKQTNGLKSPRIPSKSHHIIESKGNNSNHAKAKKMEDIESSDEFSRITNAIAPKNNYVIQKITDESNDIVIKFSLSSEAQDEKPVLKHEIPENVFEDLIFKVRSLNSHGKKESTTVRPLHVMRENLSAKYRKPSEHHVVNNEKVVRLRAENKRTDFKHKRLLSILNSLEQEVNNIKFDDELKHLFDIKMRKIYKTGVNKSQETPSLIKLVSQHDEKDLEDLRHYLENENNASVENEIATLRRMIHRMSKGTQNDHELAYAETENNPNQNYNYVDQHFDEYHETQYDDDIDNLYEDIPSITAHSEHQDYDDKFNDISKSKHNAARQFDYSIDLRDNSKTRNQETFVNNDARQEILSTAIDHHFDNYDEKNIELEQRAMNKILNARQRVGRINKYLDRIERDENLGRRTSTFPDRRLQISHPSNRRHQNGDMRRKRMRRPNLLGTLRQSRNEPRESIFSNERNIIMY